jgi:ligand-binding sensor domain-containing protein/signal transduction histidine kinase
MQIVQDNLGFMWFGTQYGLNRYDGYKFKVFAHEPGHPNSLSGVYIYALFKDRSGFLWIACDEFLDKFDPITETFTHYRIRGSDTQNETGPVFQISQDHTGMLWLSTLDGLYRFDPETGQSIRYAHDPKDPFSLSDSSIRYIYEDKEGNFWVATAAGVDRFDLSTRKVTLHIPLHELDMMSLYEDSRGVLWIIHGSGGGLAVFDRKKDTLTRYSFRGPHPGGSRHSGVLTILEDREGNLWCGTQGDGLLKFDRQGRRFIRYHNEPESEESLPEDSVRQLFEDREGTIWAALNVMAPVRFTTQPPLFEEFKHEPNNPNSLSSTMVDAIFEDREGILWISSDDALNRLDRKTGQYTTYRTEGPRIPVEADSIVEDRRGILWIATAGHGLKRFDRKTGSFQTFVHNPNDRFSLSSNFMTRLLIDHAGTLWATSFGGLTRFDPATSHFTRYIPDAEKPAPWDITLAEDRLGILWIGTHFSGLKRFDPATGQFTVYRHNSNDPRSLSDNRVNSVLFDHLGTMWVGTQNGLDRFDPGTHSFAALYEHDGLPGNVASCILEDKRGTLWIGTNNGLSAFDPVMRTFKNYSSGDGLPGNDLSGWNSCYKSASGELFFSGFSGAIAFRPENITNVAHIPPVALTDVRVAGIPVLIGASSQLKNVIDYTKAFRLPNDYKNLSLEFSALSYFNPATNRYRYTLEGLDHEWNEVGGNQRLANYTTLPTGHYTFRVQGATSRGAWSEPGLMLPIDILPPWWEKWWFMALSIAVLALLVLSAYRYRLRQVENEYRARVEERVSERTRIARDLHDTLLQSFHGLLLSFQTVYDLMPTRPAEARQTLASAIDEAAEAITEGRDAVEGLRSPTVDTNDIAEAIKGVGEELATERSNHTSAVFRVEVEGAPRNLHPILRDEVYRTAGEALRNAFQHARARQIEVEIHYDDRQFRLRVRDDGKGIDPEVLAGEGRAGHYGLHGMRERAKLAGGKLAVWSELDSGTEIELTIPASAAYKTLPRRSWLPEKFSRRKTNS